VKKLLINTGKALLYMVSSAIITAWITGKPLTGLTKLRGLYSTFIQSSVPAWAFALAVMVALFGLQYTLTHLPKRRRIGKVHFVPDAHNNGWAKLSDNEMEVRIGGTFTYDGPGELVVLKAFLKGTKPTTDILANVEQQDGSGRMTNVRELWLESRTARRAFIHLRLTPVVGTPGQPLRRALVLRDKFTEDFVIHDSIEFKYIGK
jgi:hypothetical protein